jgi:pyruvate kinase
MAFLAFAPAPFPGLATRTLGRGAPKSVRTLPVPRWTPAAMCAPAAAPLSEVVPNPAALQDPGARGAAKMAEVLDAIPHRLRASVRTLPEDADVVALGKRHTKIIATIGPSTSSPEQLLQLAAGGVNLVRLNLSHGDYEWHAKVIEATRDINRSSPFVLGTIIDLGSLDSVRLGEFSQPPVLQRGDLFTLTNRHQAEYPDNVSEVSSDAFLDVACTGDLVQVQGENGSQVEMLVVELGKSDVVCRVTAPGQLRSRGAINIRGKSLNITSPSSASEDINASIARAVLGCPPEQLEFAVRQRVEYVALSFVESPEQILAVRRLLRDRGANIGVIAKIESPDALKNLDDIVSAADAVMIARGDLGTAIHYAKVPYWQDIAVQTCLRHGKPSMISTHFLESMVLYPTPTRAEVTDMTEAVKQRTDGMVLTAETASGRFPFKAVATMNAVIMRTERKLHEEDPLEALSKIPPLTKDPSWWSPHVGDVAENIACAAATLANERNAAAILVFTQKGLMATLTSRYRPQAPIYAFAATPTVRNKLNLLNGVRPFRIDFEDDPEDTIHKAIEILKERRAVNDGDLVIVLADVLGGRTTAKPDEIERVFSESSKGGRYISSNEVRNALRRLGLKVSDKVEAQLGMRDVDHMDTGMEVSSLRTKVDSGIEFSLGQERFDFERFSNFASQAQEIVHTVQMRYVS